MNTLIAFALGLVVGGVLAAWWMWERFIHDSNTMQIEFKVDQSVLDNLNEHLVMAWLDQRGLVWMPKGMERVLDRKTR